MPASAAPSGAATAFVPPAPVAAAAPAPLVLDHPQEIDGARLSGDGKIVGLFGVTGANDPAHGLQGFIQAEGGRVTCEPHGGADTFICLLPDRTDIALVLLANGAAEATPDAPDTYHAQEEAAQAARRGMWSNLPPPPVTVSHPVVRTTALLVAEGQTIVLDGLEGIPGKAAEDFQAYIAAHGDSLLCQPQGGAGHYLCTLPDGSDIGKVALVNGAAQVSADAPDSYRLQQAEAMANHRGLWANMAPGSQPAAVAPPPAYVLVPEDMAGPVVYVGDQPTAEIDGESVFLVYGDGLGWGYYDHFHHWRGAPDRFARHLDRFHPGGHGLRGYGGRGPEFHGEHPGFAHAGAGFHEGRPGFDRGGFRPGVGHEAPGLGRGGPAPGFARGGTPGFGGGFGRPGMGGGLGRPGGMQMAARAAPAAHMSAPAPRGRK
jgi:endonuclease YncB( thermonuclease family)